MRDGIRSMLVGAILCVSSAAMGQTGQTPPADAAVAPVEPPAYLTDSEADLRAITEARIAALKTVLQLSSEQEPLFEPVAEAIRQGVDAARKRDAARYSADAKAPSDFLDVLDTIVAAEAERGEHLKSVIEAFRPLAGALSEEQLRRAPPFLGMVDVPYGEQPSSQLWIVSE